MMGIVYTVLVLSAVCGLVVAWISYIEVVQNNTLTRRVDALLLGPARADSGKGTAFERIRLRLGRWIRAVFTIGFSRAWGMSATLLTLLLSGLVAAAIVSGLVHLVLRLPAYLTSFAGLGAFLMVPRLLLAREQHKADALFNELLPDAIDMVVRMVRAGLPVAAAIRAVGSEADWPAGRIFGDVADLAEIGMPLPEALAKLGASVGNPDFRFFGVAVALQQATGGNLALTLDTLSEIIRKRRAVRLKARAATAEIRISAIVLAAIPFFIVGALLLVSPGYLQPLFTDPRGNIIVGSAVLSLVLAGVTMRWMMRAAVKG